MQQYFDTLTDDSGNSLLGATVLVNLYPAGTPAPIYSSNGTVSPIANSTVVADITGQINFYAPDGAYQLVYSYKGTPYKTRSPVQLADPMAFVAVADTGSANAYAVTDQRLPNTLYQGLKVEITAAHSCTGASTFNLNSTGNIAIVQSGGSALVTGNIIATGIYRLEYDGTHWQLVSIEPVTAQQIAQLLYPTTAAETLASVTPANFLYPPGNVWRYFAGTPVIGSDWTTAIQASINQCCYGGNKVFFPLNASNATEQQFPSNYAISASLVVPAGATYASLQMEGESSRLSFAGPAIQQGANVPHFAFNSNQPCAFDFENLGFQFSGSALLSGGKYGMIDIQPTGSSPNSFYFRRCWFQNPFPYAIYISRGDDTQISDCTFDTSGNRWLAFGSTAAPCTNVAVRGCTFFCNSLTTVVDLMNVNEFQFQGNRVYYDGTHQILYGINCQVSMPMGNPVGNTSAVISDNSFNGVVTVVQLDTRTVNLIFDSNVCTLCGQGTLAFGIGGGTAVTGVKITNNTFSGWCGSGVGMVDSTGTGLIDSVIKGNIIRANVGGTSTYGVNVLNAANSGLDIDNIIVGATTAVVFAGVNVRVRNSGDQPMSADPSPSAAQSITANGQTITTVGVEVAIVSSNGAYSGMILQAGTGPGQKVTVVSQSGASDTLTFAASGTSNVANGTSCNIPTATALEFVWNALASLWYPKNA